MNTFPSPKSALVAAAKQHAGDSKRFLLSTGTKLGHLRDSVRKAVDGTPFAADFVGTGYLQPKFRDGVFGGNVQLLYANGVALPAEILVEPDGVALYFRDLDTEAAAHG